MIPNALYYFIISIIQQTQHMSAPLKEIRNSFPGKKPSRARVVNPVNTPTGNNIINQQKNLLSDGNNSPTRNIQILQPGSSLADRTQISPSSSNISVNTGNFSPNSRSSSMGLGYNGIKIDSTMAPEVKPSGILKLICL